MNPGAAENGLRHARALPRIHVFAAGRTWMAVTSVHPCIERYPITAYPDRLHDPHFSPRPGFISDSVLELTAGTMAVTCHEKVRWPAGVPRNDGGSGQYSSASSACIGADGRRRRLYAADGIG